jgi:hypothetical protein
MRVLTVVDFESLIHIAAEVRFVIVAMASAWVRSAGHRNVV